MTEEEARITYDLGKDALDWKVKAAQKDLLAGGLDKSKVMPLLYRPFDIRYTYYTGSSGGFHCRPRKETMEHMHNNNIALCVGRAGNVVGLEKMWNLSYLSTHMIDFNLFYRGGVVLLPLYSFKDYFSKDGLKLKETNFAQLFSRFSATAYAKLHLSKNPELIIYYIYALLSCNTFRLKYSEFLKSDFPRIPFTANIDLFKRVAELGSQLADLHLLKAPSFSTPAIKFYGQGTGRVAIVKYDASKKRVSINGIQYFEPVRSDTWDYYIGGYKVMEKWLKDRKGRELSLDETATYCKISTALEKTIEIQKEIDALYYKVEETLAE